MPLEVAIKMLKASEIFVSEEEASRDIITFTYSC